MVSRSPSRVTSVDVARIPGRARLPRPSSVVAVPRSREDRVTRGEPEAEHGICNLACGVSCNPIEDEVGTVGCAGNSYGINFYFLNFQISVTHNRTRTLGGGGVVFSFSRPRVGAIADSIPRAPIRSRERSTRAERAEVAEATARTRADDLVSRLRASFDDEDRGYRLRYAEGTR